MVTEWVPGVNSPGKRRDVNCETASSFSRLVNVGPVSPDECVKFSLPCVRGAATSLYPCSGAFLSYQRVSISTLALVRETRSKSNK